jgi:threonine dehydrogenase-like Zn-dependent dehydrogenase
MNNAGSRLVFRGPSDLYLAKVASDMLSAGEVRVRTVYSLVSNGTERTVLNGEFSTSSHWSRWVKYPFYPGYSTVGVVTEVGQTLTGVAVGMRVALRAPHASENVSLFEECVPIPSDISWEDAVWFSLARIALLGVVAASPRLDSKVLIIGGGPIAQLTVRWLSVMGAKTIAILASDSISLARARLGGADVTIHGRSRNLHRDEIAQLVGKMPEIVIDCTADPDVLSWALSVVADYGRIVLLGDPSSPTSRRLSEDVLLRGITIVGTHDRLTYGRWNNKAAAELFFEKLRKDLFKVADLCTHEFAPECAVEAYRVLVVKPPGTIGIRFRWISDDQTQ